MFWLTSSSSLSLGSDILIFFQEGFSVGLLMKQETNSGELKGDAKKN